MTDEQIGMMQDILLEILDLRVDKWQAQTILQALEDQGMISQPD